MDWGNDNGGGLWTPVEPQAGRGPELHVLAGSPTVTEAHGDALFGSPGINVNLESLFNSS